MFKNAKNDIVGIATRLKILGLMTHVTLSRSVVFVLKPLSSWALGCHPGDNGHVTYDSLDLRSLSLV